MSDLPKKTEKAKVQKPAVTKKEVVSADKPTKKAVTPTKVAKPKTTASPRVSKKVVAQEQQTEPRVVVTPETISPEVVVLPQSHNKVFLIWRAEPVLDESTDSWVIRTSFGEHARVPARSRSAFLTGSGKFNVDIFRVSKDGSEELFTSHGVEVQGYSEPSNSPTFGRLNSSSANFRRRISS
ncbi:MAG: hypothetical protein ACRCY4_07790 [Brevinema sp.]